jgi:GlpG protein
MRVIETTLDDDLAPISAHLWSAGIPHRVFEERGRQVLELADPGQGERAAALIAAWRGGRLPRAAVEARAGGGRAPAVRLLRGMARYPALSALVLLTLVVFPFSVGLGSGRPNGVAGALLILDPAAASGARGLEALLHGQLWRWVTPILLHFSIVHLAFNCVIVIELGRRIEAACGSLGFGAVVLGTAVASNLAQLVAGGSLLFGGLSGVGYGLLGFLLVMARRGPGDPRWRLPRGLAGGLLIFLVVFTTGITEPFGLNIANAAHWGGLLSGGLLALCWPGAGQGPQRGRGLLG